MSYPLLALGISFLFVQGEQLKTEELLPKMVEVCPDFDTEKEAGAFLLGTKALLDEKKVKIDLESLMNDLYLIAASSQLLQGYAEGYTGTKHRQLDCSQTWAVYAQLRSKPLNSGEARGLTSIFILKQYGVERYEGIDTGLFGK